MARITTEDFVRAWQTATSLEDAARKLNIPTHYASSKAAGLRAKGILLKKFTTANNELDIEALNKLARELEK